MKRRGGSKGDTSEDYLDSFLLSTVVSTVFGESRSDHAGIEPRKDITAHGIAVGYDGRQLGALSEKLRQPCDFMYAPVHMPVVTRELPRLP